MNKLLFSLMFSLFFVSAFSQAITETVTKEVCSCIEAKKATLKDVDAETLKMQMGFCILDSYAKHTDDIVKEYGKILDNDKAMEKFGESIGLKMASVCPETLMAIAGSFSDELDGGNEKTNLTFEGEIISIKTEEFVTIQIKDKNKRVHNLMVLDYFETASLFTNNEIKVKDTITVTYTEKELYDPKSKEFRYYKVLTNISK